jgi:hypothetical protein
MISKKTIFVALAFIIFMPVYVSAQIDYRYDYEFVSKIVFKDKKVIDKLLLDLFIPESDVKEIEIFDIDGNGPNQGDLMRVVPSMNVYNISMLTKETSDIFSQIEPAPNVSTIGYTKFINANPQTAEEKILYILGIAITKLYSQEKPIKVYFEQHEDGTFNFNLYGYERSQLDDKAELNIGEISESQVQDLLKALYQEFASEYKGFQPTVVRIREIIRDTVYVPMYSKKKK